MAGHVLYVLTWNDSFIFCDVCATIDSQIYRLHPAIVGVAMNTNSKKSVLRTRYSPTRKSVPNTTNMASRV